MSLTLAISKNSKSIVASNATYKKNVALVGSFVASVIKSKLPAFQQDPPHLNEFTDAYIKATADAMQWTNEVLARLTSSPESVLSYNKVIADILTNAISNASDLVKAPGDQLAMGELKNDLAALSQQLGLVVDFVSTAQAAASGFSNTLPDMAAQLQGIASKASEAANADQGKIDTLNDDVSKFRQDINSLNATITDLHLAQDAEVTIGLTIFAANWIAGLLVGFFLAAIIGIEEVFVHMDSEEIQADQQKIQADLAQIKSIEADVAALNLLASNYATMAGQVTQVESALGEVVKQWTTLQSDINEAIADIDDALADASAGKLSAVLTDLQLASDEWESVVGLAGSLAISLTVSDADIQVGMSSGEVAAAVASGTKTELVKYLNQPAA